MKSTRGHGCGKCPLPGTRITLADVPQPELERIAALGFDGVWLMGVWERSPRSRAIASSIPDLLSDYHVLCPTSPLRMS